MFVKDAMQSQVVVTDPERSLAETAMTMQTLKIRRIPVLLGTELVGLITNSDVKRRLPTGNEGLAVRQETDRAGNLRVKDVMCDPVWTTSPGEALDAAIRTMTERRIGGLPVVDKAGRLAGMLTRTDVLHAAATAPRDMWGEVRQHMTESAITVGADTLANEATAKLTAAGLRVLPVIEGGRMVGLLHERDLREDAPKAGAEQGGTDRRSRFFLQGVKVRDLMRPAGGEVLATVPLRDAIMRMLGAHVYGLPVVDDEGQLLGVFTISDALKTILGEREVRHV